jgi:Zn-dependent peptidase ImmA (M78 family)
MNERKPDYERARKEAYRLLIKNYISAPPIDLEELAESEGLHIAVASFKEKDISGLIDLEKQLILVNLFDSSPRQRFTIAHELGHWVLHQDEIFKNKDIVVLFRKNLSDEESDPLEQEANYFAANLLVPLMFLNELTLAKSNKELAEIFDVSESVIAIRRGSLHVQ